MRSISSFSEIKHHKGTYFVLTMIRLLLKTQYVPCAFLGWHFQLPFYRNFVVSFILLPRRDVISIIPQELHDLLKTLLILAEQFMRRW